MTRGARPKAKTSPHSAGELSPDGVPYTVEQIRLLDSQIEAVADRPDYLRRHGVNTVRDLVGKTESEVAEYRQFGRDSLQNTKTRLERAGLYFRDRYGYTRAQFLDAPLIVLGIPTAAFIRRAWKTMTTVRELAEKTAAELLEIPYFGERHLEGLRAKLAEHDVQLSGDEK